jgi:uncharacterized membrane protein
VRFEVVLALCGLVVSAVLIGATRGRLRYQRLYRIPDPDP